LIPIQIDSTPLFKNLTGFTSESANALLNFTVQEVAANFASLWEIQAQQKLKSSRDQYLRSIVVKELSPSSFAVDLVGQIPNMIESGAPSYDMKEGLLKGKNSKVGKDGKRFNIVPFTFGTPGALSENFTSILPQEVYEAILEKPQDVPIIGGVSTQGLTLNEIPEKYREKQSRMVQHPVSKAWKHYEHKSSIYEGVVRQKSNVTRQNSYVSFRRVSENSDPFSWIHPGFVAMNLSDLALNELNIPFIMGRSIDEFLKRNGYI